ACLLPAIRLAHRHAIAARVVAQLAFEDAAQRELAAVKTNRERALAETQTSGRLGLGRLLDAAGDQYLPRLGRGRRHRAAEEGRQVVALQLQREVVLGGGYVGRGLVGLARHCVEGDEVSGLAAVPAAPAQANVARDGAEPAIRAGRVGQLSG